MCISSKQEIRLIVGLGNPGAEYRNTRHNAGFIVAEAVASELQGSFTEKKVHKGILVDKKIRGGTLFIFKPLTYMNLSGEAVAHFISEKQISPREMLLIYDDVDIPLGRIKIASGGSSAGHNGVESVISMLGDANFARLRLGIGGGSESGRSPDFVLSEFTVEEKEVFGKEVVMAVDAVKLLLYRGIEKAMNQFNGQNAIDYMKPEKIKESKEKKNSINI